MAAEPASVARAGLGDAFVAAFSMLAFEVLALRQLEFVSNQLTASTVIALAVMGIAASVQCDAWLERRYPAKQRAIAIVGLALSQLFIFASFPLLGTRLPWAAPAFLLPFIFGGVLLSQAFRFRPAGRVYGVDLTGAALGVIAVVVLIPLVREEGSQLIVASIGLAYWGFTTAAGWRWLLRSGAAALVVFAIANAATDTYNLARWLNDAKAPWIHLARTNHRKPNQKVIYSAASLAGRIDFVARKNYSLLYDTGWSIDIQRTTSWEKYRLDPRIPKAALPASPKVFVIGSAGEGILKSLRQIQAKVVAAEINGKVVDALRGPLAARCGDCYHGVESRIGDGRSILARSNESFDMITLLNCHRGEHSPVSAEFIHTKQAINLYLDRLSDQGIVNWEERRRARHTARTAWSTHRIIATAMTALRERGVRDPAAHIIVYRWTSGLAYDQILVRKTPWAPSHLKRMRRWLKRTLAAKAGVNAPFNSRIRIIWMPDRRHLLDGEPTAYLLKHGVAPPGAPPLAGAPITDERPFPFHLYPRDGKIYRPFALVGAVALILVLFPVAARWRKRASLRTPGTIALIGAAALSGLGYLLIEVVLMQHLQLLLGSPTLAIVLVLGTMLLSSGLGALWGHRAGQRWIRRGLLALPIMLALWGLFLPQLLNAASGASDWVRMALAVVLAALPGWAMGLPLPLCIDQLAKKASSSSAPMAYGVNGALSALGTMAALKLATDLGFSAVYWIGCGVYALTAVLLIWATRRAANDTAAPDLASDPQTA